MKKHLWILWILILTAAAALLEIHEKKPDSFVAHAFQMRDNFMAPYRPAGHSLPRPITITQADFQKCPDFLANP